MEPCSVWQCGNLANREGNFHGQVECFQKELASVHNSIMVMLRRDNRAVVTLLRCYFSAVWKVCAQRCARYFEGSDAAGYPCCVCYWWAFDTHCLVVELVGAKPCRHFLAQPIMFALAPGLVPMSWLNVLRQFAVGMRRAGSLLVVTIASIIINAVLNALLILDWFGLPNLGLAGNRSGPGFARSNMTLVCDRPSVLQGFSEYLHRLVAPIGQYEIGPDQHVDWLLAGRYSCHIRQRILAWLGQSRHMIWAAPWLCHEKYPALVAFYH